MRLGRSGLNLPLLTVFGATLTSSRSLHKIRPDAELEHRGTPAKLRMSGLLRLRNSAAAKDTTYPAGWIGRHLICRARHKIEARAIFSMLIKLMFCCPRSQLGWRARSLSALCACRTEAPSEWLARWGPEKALQGLKLDV